MFNSEGVYGDGAGFFVRVAFPSTTRGYKMYGDNGGRNASRALRLPIQPSGPKVRHCYKHEDSYLRLGPSVSNRLLAFATQTKVLRFLLIVTTKIKLIRRGEGVIFTKLSLQSIQHSRLLPSPSLPHKVSRTITTVNVTGANQTSSSKI